MKNFHIFLALIIFLLKETKGAKFLLLSYTVESHIREKRHIASALQQNGHEIHFVLPDNYHKSRMNSLEKEGVKVKTYKVPNDVETFMSPSFEQQIAKAVLSGTIDPNIFSLTALNECELLLEDENLKKDLKAEKYDMCIVDTFAMCRCLQIMAHILDIPFINAGGIIYPIFMRIPLLPSFFPNVFSHHSDRMTFTERLVNTFVHFMIELVSFQGNKNTTLLRKYVKDTSIKTMDDLSKKASLSIFIRDHLLEWPIYTTPNVIVVAGLSPTPPQQLPIAYANFVEGATDGVIIVSFGSVLKNVPMKMTLGLMNIFQNLTQRVVWGFSGNASHFKYIPDNVMLSKWIPQNDLLGHPNVKLFITHCGNNGQYEALYHAVPMIGFPVFADQPHNAFRIMEKGLGQSLSLSTFTEELLHGTIKEVLKNPKYSRNIKKLSAIMKDRPMTERERVAWAIEHVLKFGDAHLRSYALDMPWYQFYMLDILVVVLSGIFIIGYVLQRLLSFACKKIFIKKYKQC